jgi:hypothetical protein
MALTIEQVQAIGIPKNISRLNNRSFLGVAIPNESVNLYEAIELVHDSLVATGSGTETDLTATQGTTTTTLHSSTGDDVVILAADATRSGVMSAAQATNVASLVTLSGVSAAATSLGTFTGATISDSSTIKTALQELETALEVVAGESSQDAVGNILTDTATIDFTYDDGTPQITASVIDASITYAKIQNISTNNRLLGRSTSGAGVTEEITVGSGLSLSAGTLTATGGSGTVTSVAITTPGFLSVTGSPITTSGTLALSLATQVANTVLVGPTSGTSAPTFRLLVAGDIPSLTAAKISDFSEAVDDRINALLIEGAGITLTYDDVANTLSIDASGLGYTDEEAQDAIGSILLDSTTIDLGYNDSTPSITAGVKSDSLTNSLLTAGTGGIYKGSGTIASGTVSTVTASSSYRINYASTEPALLVDDFNNTTSIFSDNGDSYVSANDTQLLLSGVTDITLDGYTIFNDVLKLASYNDAGRSALTPANGMIIYNSAVHEFQGYENGSWKAFTTGPVTPE